MKLQDWFNEQLPYDKDLIYANAACAQIIWVRDKLAFMIFNNVLDTNPELEDYDERKKLLTVESTHTSKSCLLPVYLFTIGELTIKIRYNFYDWCVKVNGIDMTVDDFPEWMNVPLSRGYYEGMVDDKCQMQFCVYGKEQIYAILWWMLNEGR